jgi:hypothetical protein
MANTDIKLSELATTATVANSDIFVVVRSPNSSPTTNTLTLNVLRSNFLVADTPADSNALTISSGVILYDSDYLYVATANNVVKRVALSSF